MVGNDGNPVKDKQISYINVNKKEKNYGQQKRNHVARKKVNQLIANSATKWGETDREWLLEQDATTLEKLIPEPQKPVETAKPVETVKPVTVNLEQVREAMKGVKDVETYLEMMPDAMRDHAIRAGRTYRPAGTSYKQNHHQCERYMGNQRFGSNGYGYAD